VTVYATAPQWQEPVCVVRSWGSVSSTNETWSRSRGGALEKDGLRGFGILGVDEEMELGLD
jgi:hypothetical protein